jgi:membrane-associated phospholipid phosphatase
MNKRRKKSILYMLSAIIVGFIALTILVSLFPNSLIDQEVSEEVQEHHNIILDNVMKGISWFGYMPVSLIMVIITASAFYLFHYKREALFILLTLIAGLVSSVIKIAINRPRPEAGLVNIIVKTSHQSFPSGHVLFYVMFFGMIIVIMYSLKTSFQKLRLIIIWICTLLILTVPLSRVYLGAHWFTDVLGGFLAGIICLFILGSFYLKNTITKSGIFET